MQYDEFAAAEKSGWSEDARADAYVDLFASISDQLIPSLLEASKAAPGKGRPGPVLRSRKRCGCVDPGRRDSIRPRLFGGHARSSKTSRARGNFCGGRRRKFAI